MHRKADLPTNSSWNTDIRGEQLATGRVLRTEVETATEPTSRRLITYNVHNFDIRPNERQAVKQRIEADLRLAETDPEHYAVVVTGNFLAPGDSVKSLTDPTATHNRVCDHLWQTLLYNCVEMEQLSPTHFNSSSNSTSRLDRTYIAAPSWIFTMTQADGFTIARPDDLHAREISDHTPVCVQLRAKKSQPRESQPIGKHIFQLPQFKILHDSLCDAAGLDKMGVVTRWETHKAILKEAARLARDEELLQNADKPWCLAQTLSTAARCVWFNNTALAKKLISRSPSFATHVRVQDGNVSIVDQSSFEAAFIDAKRAWRAHEATAIEELIIFQGKTQLTPKKNALERMSRLWRTQDKRLVLQGIRISLGEGQGHKTVTDPIGKVAALSAHWTPVFDRKPFDADLAYEILDRWACPLNLSSPPPDVQDYAKCARTLKHSSPGRDGLPYAAWAAAEEHGARTLFGVGEWLMLGYRMPIKFNDSLTCFPPKGEEENDKNTIVRFAQDTRPLGLKNSDNKIIGGVQNNTFKHLSLIHI